MKSKFLKLCIVLCVLTGCSQSDTTAVKTNTFSYEKANAATLKAEFEHKTQQMFEQKMIHCQPIYSAELGAEPTFDCSQSGYEAKGEEIAGVVYESEHAQ